MSEAGKSVIKSLKEAITNDEGNRETVVSVNLDEIKRLYPPDITNEDFNRMIEAERDGRTGWTAKQASKGKEE